MLQVIISDFNYIMPSTVATRYVFFFSFPLLSHSVCIKLWLCSAQHLTHASQKWLHFKCKRSDPCTEGLIYKITEPSCFWWNSRWVAA